MARSIKKQVKNTHVDVFKADFDTMQVVKVGEFDVLGGLGERLCKSRAVREFGEGVQVRVTDSFKVYMMDFDTFIANAILLENEDGSPVDMDVDDID